MSGATPPRGAATPPRRSSASQDGGSSPHSPRTPGERLAAGSAAVRLDWASSSSSEQHVPKLLDSRGHVTQSHMLSPFCLRQLAGAVPARFAFADWRLLYSTAVHGISLNTLYHRAAGCGCCLMSIKDGDGNVFGAFCSEWREPFTPEAFYGSGETFLFSVERLHGLPPLLGKKLRLSLTLPIDYLLSPGLCYACDSGRGAAARRGGARPSVDRQQVRAAHSNALRGTHTPMPRGRLLTTAPALSRLYTFTAPFSCSHLATTSPSVLAAILASISTPSFSTARRDRARPLATLVCAGSGPAACPRTTTRPLESFGARSSRCGGWTMESSRGGSRR